MFHYTETGIILQSARLDGTSRIKDVFLPMEYRDNDVENTSKGLVIDLVLSVFGQAS